MIRILLLVDCANDFDRNLLRGIVRYSRENGPWLFYRLPSYYKSIENGERSILEWAKTWKADAIIGQWNDDAMDLLKELNIPVVLQNYRHRSTTYSNLTGDYEGTGLMAARFFAERLFRNFAFFGVKGVVWSDERCKGYRREVERIGGTFHAFETEKDNERNREALSRWLRELPKPVALFCCDDAHALTISEICKMENILIPEDVSLLGVDNDELICNISDPDALARQGLFAVVADGMGGMDSGNEASEAAVDSMVRLFRGLLEEGDVPQQLREGVLAASDGIFQRFQGRSGTTVVAVRILGAELHWLSVGDSAIFLKRGECVFQLNREHTCLNDLYLRELEQEPIQKERAEQDEDARRLTAFVGMDRLDRADQSLRPWHLQPGDVVLLCSDGISGVLTVPELKEAMSVPPDEGCRLLETMVAEKALPAQDNYTGVLIAYQFKQTGERGL